MRMSFLRISISVRIAQTSSAKHFKSMMKNCSVLQCISKLCSCFIKFKVQIHYLFKKKRISKWATQGIRIFLHDIVVYAIIWPKACKRWIVCWSTLMIVNPANRWKKTFITAIKVFQWLKICLHVQVTTSRMLPWIMLKSKWCSWQFI